MNRRTLALGLAAVVQIAILIGVPLTKATTRLQGRGVILQVEPVDPYAVLSGYYVRLGYPISRVASFPGGLPSGVSGDVFAVVEAGPDSVWKPVRLLSAPPSSLPADQAFIRGRLVGDRIEFGIESFHYPEDKRQVIEADLRRNMTDARVDVWVGAKGDASLMRLRIADRVYE